MWNSIVCSDFDEDCEHVECKAKCSAYDLTTGLCPYLFPQILAPFKNSHQVITLEPMA